MKKTEIQVLKKKIQVLSVLVARNQLLYGISTQSYGGARDIYQALGYLENPKYTDYLARYKHQDIAKAVIDRPVKATWRGPLALLESEQENETALEKAFTDLNKRLKLKSIFSRVDRLSSLGKYGILYLGLDDVKGVDDYANEVKTGKRVLKYLKPFGEGSATITEYEAEPTNERYGLPKFYQIQVQTIGGESTMSVKVHYSRVIHIIEDQLENDIEGNPTLEAIFNCLMDIEKITGGDAEMFWRGARPGHAAVEKEGYNLTSDEQTALKDQFDEYEHNLRRILTLKGIDLEAIQSQVADNPQTHFDIQIQKISAQTAIPKRILTGSERGELASSQDADEWSSFVLARREEYAEPNIVRPFVDRCMELGILPLVEDYEVSWSDLFAISTAQQVEIGVKRATALNQYVTSPIAQQIVSPDAFLEYFGGFSQEDIELINSMATDEILLEPVVTDEENELLTQGGAGSGNFDHEGRPGEVGGSGDGGSRYNELRTVAESVLKDQLPNELDYRYVGFSDTNGESMYFNVFKKGEDLKTMKVRFSDHNVTNTDRIENEAHFSFTGVNQENSINKIGYYFGLSGYKYEQVTVKGTVKVPKSNLRGRKIIEEFDGRIGKMYIVENEVKGVWRYTKN